MVTMGFEGHISGFYTLGRIEMYFSNTSLEKYFLFVRKGTN